MPGCAPFVSPLSTQAPGAPNTGASASSFGAKVCRLPSGGPGAVKLMGGLVALPPEHGVPNVTAPPTFSSTVHTVYGAVAALTLKAAEA